MNFKKRVNGSWVNIPCYTYKTSTEAVENPLYSDGTAITNYTISGNTVQNGTPTPSNPVDVVGVGVRTENLFKWRLEKGQYGSDGVFFSNSKRACVKKELKASIEKGDYIISMPTNAWQCTILLFNQDGTMADNQYALEWHSLPFAFSISDDELIFTATFKSDPEKILIPSELTPMLSTGSTAKPYEPYGYKIPISSGGMTTNIYLGSTQTTRKIKKLALTGEEGWNQNTTSFGMRFFIKLMNSVSADTGAKRSLCTHYPLIYAGGTSAVANAYTIGSNGNLYISSDTITGVVTFKQYLSSQYAAGTPVTVWYVLATETTGIVNEPLMKIGDYADTLSNATAIPTTEGANSITVDTTVQPSEFTATWTGWHNASVKEWDGSDWN